MEDSMSWGEIFFGFSGRINRKTYWLASLVLAVAGFLFLGLLSSLATGNALAPQIWDRSAENASVWLPVWAAYYAFLFWPQSALAVKRLHDRGHPPLVWYIYFAAVVALALIPAKGVGAAFILIIAPVAVLGFYLFIELGLRRGTAGPNAYGADTLPADYYGGGYSFSSWMLAVEGRISRSKWWAGIMISFAVTIAASLLIGSLITAFASMYPGLEENLKNPDWRNSPEAQSLILKLTLWLVIPMLLLALALWSFIALGVKRLHDRGLSTWLILVVILPFLFLLFVSDPEQKLGWSSSVIRIAQVLCMASVIWSILQFGIFKGEIGPNRNGPDPLAGG
jgi:uncharacterized membrane protein YhaH (DUF805 family)